MFKKILQFKLKVAAKIILNKYKPEVVGITGSVGKTSTKDAIYTVLSSKFNVRKNIKNYNNEIGLPLTILGAESPGKNPFGWLVVGFKFWKLVLIKDKSYPKILVLEMAIDRPGDMDYLCGIVKPKIGVVTNISHSHFEFFSSISQIQKEKAKLVKLLPKNGWAVLDYDDQKTRSIAGMIKDVNITTYGFDHHADIQARSGSIKYSKKGELVGMNFKLTEKGSAELVEIHGVVGYPMIRASLAAASIGLIYGLTASEISNAIKKFKTPRGRTVIVKAIKKSTIIDDTYNASPVSTTAIIATMDSIETKRGTDRWAILGDMLELGNYKEEGHRIVGKAIVTSRFNKLVAVGDLGYKIGLAAKKAGMQQENIYSFEDSSVACSHIAKLIKDNSLILIKGSQGARMERIVKCLMAEPGKAADVLVRQGKEWK